MTEALPQERLAKRKMLLDRVEAIAEETIPGIGVIGVTAIAATVPDPKAFRSGRDLAAWIGLVPRQDSTGGKQKLGPISKQGDQYLRRILVVGAHAVLRRARQQPEKYPWLTQLLARKPFKVVCLISRITALQMRVADRREIHVTDSGREEMAAGLC
jgi:transposase